MSNNIFKSLPFRLLCAVAAGIILGLALSATDGTGFTSAILNIIVTVRFISGQLINFCVPLIIIGFIAPSITRMGQNAPLIRQGKIRVYQVPNQK